MDEPAQPPVAISVVVVSYNMARELPRTLRSLSPPYQRTLAPDDIELIVVDNGSPDPVTHGAIAPVGVRTIIERLDPAPASPVRAANRGIALASSDLIGLFIDGARLASPGLLAGAARSLQLAHQPIITATAFHLGETTHMQAIDHGYDQTVEDQLLADSGWESDGYELFSISTLAGSSSRGIFGPKGESNSLFMRRDLWDRLGGLDDRFALPGGGLANHDLYRRACALEGTQLVELLGEGTFHQYHGGAATSGRFVFEEMNAEYESIRGHRYRPPSAVPWYLGEPDPRTMSHIEHSARLAIERSKAVPPQ